MRIPKENSISVFSLQLKLWQNKLWQSRRKLTFFPVSSILSRTISPPDKTLSGITGIITLYVNMTLLLVVVSLLFQGCFLPCCIGRFYQTPGIHMVMYCFTLAL